MDNIFDEELEIEEEDPTLILEMAGRIKNDIKVDKKGKKILIVAVGSNETRGVPHFHIFRNKNDWKDWKNGSCLMFKENKYFDHGNNNETLTKDELEALVECLKSRNPSPIINGTNWEYIIDLWNQNNDDFEIPYSLSIPDYDTITRYKEDTSESYDIMNEIIY